MVQYTFTEYFEKEVLRKGPYLEKEWCIRTLENLLQSKPQEGNRYRFWGRIEELFQTEGSSHEAQLLS